MFPDPSWLTHSTAKSWGGVILTLLLTFSINGCSPSEDRAPSHSPTSQDSTKTYDGPGPIQIACTVGMIGDLAREVVGDRGTVTTLMGPGTDPHLYKVSPGDVRTLFESDLILYAGHHLEGRMGEVFERLSDTHFAVAVCELIPEEELLSTEEGAIDPHLWFDVNLWKEVAIAIADTLVQFDPAEAEGYRNRAQTLVEQLLDLDREARQQLASVPPKLRVLLTAHDAFRYFGRAYQFEVLGIQGLSTESEAAVARINELVALIVERDLPAVFVESTISNKNVRALLEGCQSKGHTLSIGGELYSDAMGPSDSPEGTYFGMVRHNVRVLSEALR